MKDPYVGVVEWARQVGSEEAPDLRDVEDVLLRPHPANEERLEREPVNWALAAFWMLYVAAPFFALWGPITFIGGWYRGNTIEPSTINDGLPQVGIAFWFVVAFFAHQLVGWWRHRHREGFIVGIALFDVAVGLITLDMVNDGLEAFYGNATIHLVPIWATVVLAGACAVLCAVSPKNPAPPRMATKDLLESSRTLLLEEREAALCILAERGLLGDRDPDELRERPLGALHA